MITHCAEIPADGHIINVKHQISNFKREKTMSKESDFEDILVNGISFGRGGGPRKEEDKVKTKAKKKKYITGAHGSGSARQKAKYREQRANRHKK